MGPHVSRGYGSSLLWRLFIGSYILHIQVPVPPGHPVRDGSRIGKVFLRACAMRSQGSTEQLIADVSLAFTFNIF